MRKRAALAAGAATVAAGAVAVATGLPAAASSGNTTASTTTPIKHLVVIFQENVSFDHYFGTYPNATNSDGQPFHAAPGTPTVNGLSGGLLTNNPNGMNPARLGPAQALTCDQDHGYSAEQKAVDHGAMDGFIADTQQNSCSPPAYGATDPHLVLDYYDGNTVTGLWNYGQHFAMNDNSYGTTYGPSSPGALNLISGNTAGAYAVGTDGQPTVDSYAVPNQTVPFDPSNPTAPGSTGTVINDPDPAFDKCSSTSFPTAALTGENVGDLLSKANVTWGWFEGGFADCSASHPIGQYAGITGAGTTKDYIPHHEPFQYYQSTANPQHLPPTSVADIGTNADQANHQYDLTNFWQAMDNGNMPAVSFLKAPAYEDGHAGYSDPLDEQHFLVDTINRIERSPDWKSTAIVINYDDSDGWYDHQLAPVVNQSQSSFDFLTADGQCGAGGPQLEGDSMRCGYGPRLPLLVISPFSRVNFVDNTLTDQSSILRFVEDNWLGGQRIGGSFDSLAGTLNGMFNFSKPAAKPLYLSPTTGEPANGAGGGQGQQGQDQQGQGQQGQGQQGQTRSG
jgi:phospholipase C